jgi:hypothetical protein
MMSTKIKVFNDSHRAFKTNIVNAAGLGVSELIVAGHSSEEITPEVAESRYVARAILKGMLRVERSVQQAPKKQASKPKVTVSPKPSDAKIVTNSTDKNEG